MPDFKGTKVPVPECRLIRLFRNRGMRLLKKKVVTPSGGEGKS